MKTIDLTKYAPVFSNEEIGKVVFSEIISTLNTGDDILIDMTGIKSMATCCAKQVFGELYKKLGAEDFYSRVTIKGASDNVKVIIRLGIKYVIENS
jgi:hypothetical protein